MIKAYSEVLTEHYAGSQWCMNNEDYDTLQWFSNTPKPTKADLDQLASS